MNNIIEAQHVKYKKGLLIIENHFQECTQLYSTTKIFTLSAITQIVKKSNSQYVDFHTVHGIITYYDMNYVLYDLICNELQKKYDDVV